MAKARLGARWFLGNGQLFLLDILSGESASQGS
uniref:Uncharacterized protein n=1 Tax=Anguilla anguilla TaxID=7936 RepID=A0A0E9VSX0_ANGAN